MNKIFFIFLIPFIMLTGLARADISKLLPVGSGKFSYLGFINVYDVQLYAHPSATYATILSDDISRCLVIHYDVSFTSKDLIAGAEATLENQHDKEILNRSREKIDNLHSSYNDINKGDSYSLCYDAQQQSTTLLYNNKRVVTITSGKFANLYFGIWLGPENSIDNSLRNNLLKKLPRS